LFVDEEPYQTDEERAIALKELIFDISKQDKLRELKIF